MQKRVTGKLLLASFLFLILGGLLMYLSAGPEEYCFNYDCLGQSGCLKGVSEWISCNKNNPCVGGGFMKCENPPPPQ